VVRRLLVIAVLLTAPALLYAQDATLSGTVRDSSGGVLPGVTVTALHETTGNTFVAVTDTVGAFRLPVRTGSYRITVDRNKCEGKRDCVEVCPYGVFEVRRIDDADFARLSWIGKLKSRAHDRQTVYTPKLDLCQACGLCVVACPERALTLERVKPVI